MTEETSENKDQLLERLVQELGSASSKQAQAIVLNAEGIQRLAQSAIVLGNTLQAQAALQTRLLGLLERVPVGVGADEWRTELEQLRSESDEISSSDALREVVEAGVAAVMGASVTIDLQGQ